MTFPNLTTALKAENAEQLQEFTTGLEKVTDLEGLQIWQYNDLLPKGKNMTGFSFEEYKAYLLKRKTAEQAKKLEKAIQRLELISQAKDLVSLTVSVEWKRSRMWGNNPSATADEITKNEHLHRDHYESGSISGYGYDKLSTAIAKAVNQSNAFLKLLYTEKENNIELSNREIFGYGSGYGLLPYLEGGVGEGYYRSIFERIGFKWEQTASGKSFDVFTAKAV